jgi:hypothetical protein
MSGTLGQWVIGSGKQVNLTAYNSQRRADIEILEALVTNQTEEEPSPAFSLRDFS